MVNVKNFYQILEELLEYEGYELIFRGEGKIVGKSDDEIRTVIVAGEMIKDKDIEEIKDSEGEVIIVLFEKFDGDKYPNLDSEVKIWDRDILIRKIGEMELEKSVLEGITEGKGGIKGPDKDFDFDITHKRKEATLKPILDFEHISELGENLVKGFKYRLELVPHYMYTYNLTESEGEQAEGKLYFNAISGRKNFWEKPFERVADIKRSHVKLEPNISKEDSKKKAKKAIIERHSEEKEEKWEEEGVTIVEKSEDTPEEKDIEIKEQGIVYVPMWAVEGTEGIVVINAATGKVEREE